MIARCLRRIGTPYLFDLQRFASVTMQTVGFVAGAVVVFERIRAADVAFASLLYLPRYRLPLIVCFPTHKL